MKVLIINNQPIYLDGLKAHLKKIKKDLNIVEAETFEDFFSILEKDKDIFITILDMDDRSLYWRESIGIIAQKFPKMKIILLANTSNFEDMKFSYKNNVTGFIPKNFPANLLASALNFVFEGGIFYPPVFETEKRTKTNVRSMHETSLRPPSMLSLTVRQEEVLANLCKGLSNKQIAHEMNLAEATVKLHVNALLRSLGASNRTHAVITAQKLGIIA